MTTPRQLTPAEIEADAKARAVWLEWYRNGADPKTMSRIECCVLATFLRGDPFMWSLVANPFDRSASHEMLYRLAPDPPVTIGTEMADGVVSFHTAVRSDGGVMLVAEWGEEHGLRYTRPLLTIAVDGGKIVATKNTLDKWPESLSVADTQYGIVLCTRPEGANQ